MGWSARTVSVTAIALWPTAAHANWGQDWEGILREHSRLGGKWRDELLYGLLSGDRTERS